MSRVNRKPDFKKSRCIKLNKMKSSFCFLVYIAFLWTSVSAQSNNSFNARGLQIKDAVVILSNDFYAGKLKNYEQQTIDKYSAAFAIDAIIPVSMVSNLFSELTDKKFNYETYINRSGLSADAKRITIEILNSSRTGSKDIFQAMLIEKVDEINSSRLSENEKEFLLTNCAASYHWSALTNGNSQGRPDSGDGLGIGFAIGAFAGGAAGVALCGPLCGFGGAIVGGFIGAVVGSLFK
jgi:hypothetical protein